MYRLTAKQMLCATALLVGCEATDLGSREVGPTDPVEDVGISEVGLGDEGTVQRADLDGGVGIEIDAGPPPPWVLTGHLDDAAPGTELVAFSADQLPFRAPFDAEGLVAIEVPGGHAYSFYVFNGDAFVSALMFSVSVDTAAIGPVLVLPLDARAGLGSSSRDPAAPRAGLGSSSKHHEGLATSVDALSGVQLDFGGFTLEGALAQVEHNPNAQIDSDLDGVINIDDSDADNNGVDDVLEMGGDPLRPGMDLPFFTYCVRPMPLADGVYRHETPDLWMTQRISPASLLDGHIFLAHPDGRQVGADALLLDDGHRIRLLPRAPLDFDGQYVLVVDERLEDADGRAIGRRLEVPFQVEPEVPVGEAGATAVRVRRAHPRHDEIGVSVHSEVQVQFNRPVSAPSLQDRFELLDPEGVAVEGQVSMHRAGFELRFTPNAPLSPTTRYTVELASGITSIGGLVLDTPVQLAFTTGTGEAPERLELPVDADGDGEPDAPPCEPVAEVCDGLDDDCDGRIDEGFDVGSACEVGRGECIAYGARICTPEGDAACSVQPLPTSEEVCNGLDDDCDGNVDETLSEEGQPCASDAAGACNPGLWVCEGAQGLLCAPIITPGTQAESCDDSDEDCDGAVDEDFDVGGDCSAGEGACRAEGRITCHPEGHAVCTAIPGQPVVETCNGIDDDCDGTIDETLTRTCGSDTGPCEQGVQTCDAGEWGACVGEVAPAVETCDSIDNDCDGLVDEGSACSEYMASKCRVWMGHSANSNDVGNAVPDMGDCQGADFDASGNTRCTSTRGDRLFRTMSLTGPLGGGSRGDSVSVAWTCEDAELPETAAWLQDHCAVYLGHADLWLGHWNEGLGDWETCFDQPTDNSGSIRCTSSGFDGQFRPFSLPGAVDDNDRFGIAFRCVDGDDPERAAAATSAVKVFLAFDHEGHANLNDGQNSWGDCPAVDVDEEGTTVCASSGADGLFHSFPTVQRDIDAHDEFGIALLPFDAASGTLGALGVADNQGCDPGDQEVCDGVDNDCDGNSDEGFDVGAECFAGEGACRASGRMTCHPDGTAVCTATPGVPSNETCNGEDDDCDGSIDEGQVCGAYMSQHCRFWLAQVNNTYQGTIEQLEQNNWDNCFAAGADAEGMTRCASTRGDGLFREMTVSGTLSEGDHLGVAFTCADDAQPELAAWFQSRCKVYVGHATDDQGLNDSTFWGTCPGTDVDVTGDARCVSSGGDGRFHAFPLAGAANADVDNDDDLGIAFICEDDEAPQRARSANESVELYLGWSREDSFSDGDATMGDCPGSDLDNDSYTRCASTRGATGRFYKIDVRHDFEEGSHRFGIGLKAFQ
ncbi:MAG: Ig-like domain-containing protein [Bradymonadia bacterium]